MSSIICGPGGEIPGAKGSDIAGGLTVDHIKYVNDYLEAVFNKYSGYINYDELGIDKKSLEQEKVYLTYGEIKVSGLDDMIRVLDFTRNDVFYDLGSGVGKVAAHFFLKTPIKSSVGVEVNRERNNCALEVKSTINMDLPEAFNQDRKLEFYEDNILNVDISAATIIYMCSTCYGEDLMQAIGDKINSTCKNIRHVLSLKQIPGIKLPLKAPLMIDCSWGDSKSKLYWYSREK